MMTLQKPSRTGQSGFTLMELLITVAIIGILAAVAVPAYTDYSRRGQLPEATAALADYRIKMEQYYQDNRNYGSGGSCANGANAPAWSSFAATKHFTYTCTTSGQAYTVTATGSSGRATGHAYTINESGTQGTTSFKGASVSGKACWLIKGDEC